MTLSSLLLILLPFWGLLSGCGGTEPAPAQKPDGGSGGAIGSGGTGAGGGGPAGGAGWDGGIVDVDGQWLGSWVSGSGPIGMLSAEVTSSDPTLTGTITLGGTSCFGMPLPFTGTSIDLHILLFATQSASDLRIEADVTPSVQTITGTYAVSRGPCDGDKGTLLLRR